MLFLLAAIYFPEIKFVFASYGFLFIYFLVKFLWLLSFFPEVKLMLAIHTFFTEEQQLKKQAALLEQVKNMKEIIDSEHIRGRHISVNYNKC